MLWSIFFCDINKKNLTAWKRDFFYVTLYKPNITDRKDVMVIGVVMIDLGTALICTTAFLIYAMKN